MEINGIAIAASLVAGISTGIGAIPIYFKREFSKSSLDIGMGFSAGVMLVASFISLIIPSFEEAKAVYHPGLDLIFVLLSIFIGYLFIISVHDYLPHDHIFKKKDMQSKKEISRIALIVMAISLHNFPEGLAVGVGFGTGEVSSGLALATAISIQNMPEGLVVAFGLLKEGASKNRAFLMALLSGMVEPVAALLGFLSTQITLYSLPVALAFAGGMMLFVICQEMFPELFKEGHEKKATFGVILGIISMLGINYLFV